MSSVRKINSEKMIAWENKFKVSDLSERKSVSKQVIRAHQYLIDLTKSEKLPPANLHKIDWTDDDIFENEGMDDGFLDISRLPDEYVVPAMPSGIAKTTSTATTIQSLKKHPAPVSSRIDGDDYDVTENRYTDDDWTDEGTSDIEDQKTSFVPQRACADDPIKDLTSGSSQTSSALSPRT